MLILMGGRAAACQPCLLQRGEGPIAVIVAPTRELAEQIHKETRKHCSCAAIQPASP
jgi:superfamily II DNA/RNA helicase